MESEHRDNNAHRLDSCATAQTDMSSHGSGSDHHRIYCFSVSQTAQGRQTHGKNTIHKPTAAKLILTSLVFLCTLLSVAQESTETMQSQNGRTSRVKLLTCLH